MAKTDELIKRDIVDQLTWDERVDASKVFVEVTNGTVTLRGEAPSYFAKSAAHDDAWEIVGVTHVIDQLTISFRPGLALPTDAQLEADVRRRLAGNPEFNLLEIDVSVKEGIVILKGTVDSYWKKVYAQQQIEPEFGVTAVENHLAVVPTGDHADEEIARRIVSALEAKANVFADDVDVQVRNGRVTLSGTVPTWTARRAAQESAMYTAGVVGVDNRLTVSGLGRESP